MTKTIFENIPHLTGEKVNKAQLSQLLGVTLAELDTWVRAGCPCIRTGGIRSPLNFDSAQVIAWRMITAVSEENAQAARILRLEFEKDALELMVARRA